jgi:hypothetical protein
MAITIHNKTANIGTPAAITQTFSHNNGGGTNNNNYLYLVTVMANAASFQTATYAGVNMTTIASWNNTVINTWIQVWQLPNPAVGNNNIVLTFNTATWNPVSSFVFSVSGANGFGNIVSDNTASSPNSTTIAVSANSYVFGCMLSGNSATNAITIDGSPRPLEYTHNVNNYISGALSLALTTGIKNVSVSGLSDVAALYFEIKEAVSTTSTQGLLMMF